MSIVCPIADGTKIRLYLEAKCRPIAWPRTELSAFDDLNRFRSDRADAKRRARGAFIVRERVRECPPLALSGRG